MVTTLAGTVLLPDRGKSVQTVQNTQIDVGTTVSAWPLSWATARTLHVLARNR